MLWGRCHIRTFGKGVSFLFSSLISVLVLCAEFASASGGSMAEVTEEDPIIGVDTSEEGMIVTVPTGGCTVKDDFVVHTEKTENKADITIQRIRPDSCKGFFPEGEKILFPWSELGIPRGLDRNVTNPLSESIFLK